MSRSTQPSESIAQRIDSKCEESSREVRVPERSQQSATAEDYRHMAWLPVASPLEEPEHCSDDCCLNIVPKEAEVPPAIRHKPLPSFYIERLLEPASTSDHGVDNALKCMEKREQTTAHQPCDGSTVASGSCSSHRSSPISTGRRSTASEREWCISPCSPQPASTNAATCRRIREERSLGNSVNQQPPDKLLCRGPSASAGDQSDHQSTPARNVNAVFIAWPETEARGVNINRLQRELITHPSLFQYGSWLPERDANTLQEFQPHQLDLSLRSVAVAGDGSYFNIQGSTLAKRYRKQNRERKPRQAYSAMQLERLEDEFKRSIYLNVSKRFELAQCLALSETQIKTWFQNRRTKFKKQQDSRNKREQRQHAQLIAQWLLQPQLCGTGNAGQFHPATRLPVLLPPRPLLQSAGLMSSPYLLPSPLAVQQRHPRTLVETRRITVPVTVRSPSGPTAALPVPASFPARIVTSSICVPAASGSGLTEAGATTIMQNQMLAAIDRSET